MTGEERSDKLLALIERVAVALERGGLPKQNQQSALKEVPCCPLCKKPMIYRTARATGDRFWGCQQYPHCKGARDDAGNDTTRKPTPVGPLDEDNVS